MLDMAKQANNRLFNYASALRLKLEGNRKQKVRNEIYEMRRSMANKTPKQFKSFVTYASSAKFGYTTSKELNKSRNQGVFDYWSLNKFTTDAKILEKAQKTYDADKARNSLKLHRTYFECLSPSVSHKNLAKEYFETPKKLRKKAYYNRNSNHFRSARSAKSNILIQTWAIELPISNR